MRPLVLVAALAVVVPAAVELAARQPDGGRKARRVAFLVGPAEYLHDFAPLRYPARDVEALAAEFRAAGFDEVVTLTDPPEGKNPATRAAVLARLEKLVSGQADPSRNARRGDVVVVVLAGHGQELTVPDPTDPTKTRREAFFAPADGRKGQPQTLVSLGRLAADVLGPTGCRSLLLVDACRDLYDPNRGRGVGGEAVSLTGQTAILFSCSAGEQSWESDEVKHGVFTHAVLGVIRDAKAGGRALTWSGLVSRVEERMGEEAVRKLMPAGRTQTPVLAAGQVPATELFAAQATPGPRAGEEKDVAVAPGVRMRFCYVPAGEAQLGSPKAERDAVRQQSRDGKEPEWLASEAEETRGKYRTKGFWLGKYEVTQGEWAAVMGPNPSWFDGVKENRAKGLGTSRFPVEMVSWEDCQKFLEKANGHRGLGAIPLRLPHEDEWEYGCRGGKGNGRAYCWGGVLNGTEANCDGDFPFGGAAKGPNLGRPAAVGSYATVSPHPWGLCDLHGNVWEWCDNEYSNNSRVLRGGSWYDGAGYCRVAFRNWYAPDGRINYIGFRVCLPVD